MNRSFGGPDCGKGNSGLMLLVVAGAPGVGKSAIVEKLAARSTFTRVDTDNEWRALYPEPTYSPLESERVFARVAEKVTCELSLKDTVAEGVFASEARIQKLEAIAASTGSRFFVVVVHCRPDVAFHRMHLRHVSGGLKPVPKQLWHDLEAKLKTWCFREHVIRINSGNLSPALAASRLLRQLPLTLTKHR
jgi:predicted kinase